MTAITQTVRIHPVSPDEATHQADILAEALSDVLMDCVEGGASVSFMWPISRDKALHFWRGVLASAARGERQLLVAEDQDGQLVGTVQLITDLPDNQPHRADVAKMLVHRRARRRGIGQQLMVAVADVARDMGKTLLVLDTETGGDAERLYARAGWQQAGQIPNYALKPDGALCGTTLFYLAL